jgi:phage tail sheath gpL-like
MTIDASAVARVLGIATEFKDLRTGSILNLPQRIAVFAQGSTDVVFSTTKWPAPSAAAAGARFGYGSQIHNILRELMPENGDGVGTVPVTVYPLADHGSGIAAAGKIVPSGTATKTASYRARIAGYLGEAFTIVAGAITGAALTNACRAIGDSIVAVPNMPVKMTYTYGVVTGGNFTGTGNGTLTVLSVTGNPRPGVYKLTVNTVVANGGVWTLTDPDGKVISTTVTQTPGVGQATVINVGGLQFTITDSTTDFGLGASFDITVPATEVNLTCKWKGPTGNKIITELIGESLGAVFTITQLTGGLNNPSVAAALLQVGNVWETMGLNALGIEDTVALDAFATFGEGRWNELVRKPLVMFVGNNEKTVALATAVCSLRRDDRTNAQLVGVGSVNLPSVVAARQLARIAKLANNTPPHDYGSQRATGLLPGLESDQWDYANRDQAVKLGSSTIEVKDSVINISDVVTFYRPDGDPNPAYRFVVDIVKLQNCLFNFDIKFATPEWDGAPLIPDADVTTEPTAKKPKMAKAVIAGVVDNLGLAAIISDPKSAKKTISAVINSQNPKRLDWEVTVQLSGNTNIKSATLKFGFFFGVQAAA